MSPLPLLYAIRRRLLGWLSWPTRGVRAMVYDPAGQLLLVRHRYGRRDLWMLPGGGIGRRETAAAAVRREVGEETGCTLDAVEPVGTYVARAEGRRDTVHLFRAVTRDRPRADVWEIAEARFFAPDALPDALSPATRRRIDEAAGRRPRDGRW